VEHAALDGVDDPVAGVLEYVPAVDFRDEVVGELFEVVLISENARAYSGASQSANRISSRNSWLNS